MKYSIAQCAQLLDVSLKALDWFKDNGEGYVDVRNIALKVIELLPNEPEVIIDPSKDEIGIFTRRIGLSLALRYQKRTHRIERIRREGLKNDIGGTYRYRRQAG